MFETDFIMREITTLTRALQKIFFNKDPEEYGRLIDEEGNFSETELLRRRLTSMAKEGKINDAENLLFEYLDRPREEYLEIALEFYNTLAGFSDDFLTEYDYSKEEIVDGLRRVKNLFYARDPEEPDEQL